MDIFIGNMDAKMDAKGRVFVPAAFRKIMQTAGETHFIIRPDIFKNCIVLHPKCLWMEELMHLRSELGRYNEVEQNTFRTFQMNKEDVEMDANGRILLPKRYLQFAGIKSEVTFLGMDGTIEIWNKEELEKTVFNPEEFRKNVSNLLGAKR
ncbi:MAG: cell division/cell wall cluster transcriptional repressor MraZ [Dysgonamonadaceae bacterium]|jgi:MraZ protein|nr:cell division/cell wall cluster transcriptional repressor MraZ [Dysgonamonadaceae bacterium]